ncbi:hypothetical protein BH24PSE2_BH24PSE2_08040 [soil metagenome]
MNIKRSLALLLFPMVFALGGCDVDQTEEGEMPDVDVEGGNMPEYDVDAPDVDVGTKRKEITVPDIDIDAADEDEIDDPDNP